MKNEGIIMPGELGMDKGINIENKGVNREPNKKPEFKDSIFKPERKDTSISPRKPEEPRNIQSNKDTSEQMQTDKTQEEKNIPESQEQKRQKGLLKEILNLYKNDYTEFLDEKGREEFLGIKVKIKDKDGRETERSLEDGVKEWKKEMGEFVNGGKLSEERLGEIFVKDLLVRDELLRDEVRTFKDGSKVAEKFGEAYYKRIGSGDVNRGKELHEKYIKDIKAPWEKGEQPDIKSVIEVMLSQPGMAKMSELLEGMVDFAGGEALPAPQGVEGGVGLVVPAPESEMGLGAGDVLAAPGELSKAGGGGDMLSAPIRKDGKQPIVEPGKETDEDKKKKNLYALGTLVMILSFLFAGIIGEISEITERTMERVITGRTVV